MITNTGRDILSKFMIGQTSTYASYIALGIGPTPISSTTEHDNYTDKEVLDFEAIRVPISSRGYVYDEQGIPNIVFSAELPTAERYSFTEIGVFSGKSNTAAGPLDSKVVYTFSDSESWEYHFEGSQKDIPTADSVVANDVILDNPTGDSYYDDVHAFRINANNTMFENAIRSGRYESPRFLSKFILMQGDSSNLSLDVDGHLSYPDGDDHLHYTGISVPFSKNSVNDRISFAFSVLNKDGATTTDPDQVRILIEFASGEAPNGGSPDNYARFETVVDGGTYSFAENRYIVDTKQIKDLVVSPGFTWDTVDRAKIYVSVMEYDEVAEVYNPSGDYWVALDGVRFDNVTTINPLYGLTAYTVVRNVNAVPVVKRANSSNMVEFRFALDLAAFGGP